MTATKPRLLITGGSSYLGRVLLPLATGSYHVCYSYFNNLLPQTAATGIKLDLRRPQTTHYFVQAWRPDVIVHLAGSNRIEDMSEVIVTGARTIQAAAAAVKARLIHLSTDVLFDGTAAPYDETAVPTPVHEYGRAKAAAEEIIAQHANHVIVRTSLIYGLHEMDHGTKWISAALRQQKPVTLFSDQLRNPIAAGTLSMACLELADHSYRGVLNVAGEETLSRAAYALALLDWWQIEQRQTLTIAPTPADAPWPRNTALNIAKASALLRTPLHGVTKILSSPAKI